MLKKIKLKKLFGRFDYNIKLNDNGITIITGPNGYGKSTILTILDEFCNKGLIYWFVTREYASSNVVEDTSTLLIVVCVNKRLE